MKLSVLLAKEIIQHVQVDTLLDTCNDYKYNIKMDKANVIRTF